MDHRPDVGLAQVLTSAAASLGVGAYEDDLGIGHRNVAVVCLVDGLGATSIEHHPEVFEFLVDARGGSIEAAFPTTTPTGLASLGTGLEPGQHGLVGASFLLPEAQQVLSPLHWGRDPLPLSVQPEPTVFEVVVHAGIRAVTIAPGAYARSGLTAAVLRGSHYLEAETLSDRAEVLRSVLNDGAPVLAYVYWPALDRAGHEFGVDSSEWMDAAREVGELLSRLRSGLPKDATMIVTADHGMVDAADRIWIEDHPALAHGVYEIAGEPRMRHVYCTDPAEDVARRWQDVLGEHARVLTREEAIGLGLFGTVDAAIRDRIGDVVAISLTGTIMASHRVDERVSWLRGHHGALTDDERRIPALIVDGER